MAVRRQIEYARSFGVPWGIFGVRIQRGRPPRDLSVQSVRRPGLGSSAGLGDELVVAPYASALAAMLVPSQSAANLRRLAALGLEGEFGFFDAIDYTDRGRTAPASPTRHPVIVRTYMAHHQGMTLVALANALGNDQMVARFP
jgi:cyclic beta-1,2-glucan synthetase